MIGLANLPDGAHTLEHPGGVIWVLIRKGQITRCEWWDRATQDVYYWSARGQRVWPPLKRLDPTAVAREVVQAG